MGTIRAARLLRHGAPVEVGPADLPEAGPDEVLVDLRFGGINPIDRYIAEGSVAADGPLPRTLGGEASGTVSGRPVLVAGGGLGSSRDGVWAQGAVVPASAVMDLPAGVELREAAAMGVAGLTAYHAVDGLAELGPEDRVLVLGASGGVGCMIVSLARSRGATVWGQTGSEHKAALIEQQGADRVLVAGPGELATALSALEPTAVFDPLGDGFVAPVIEAAAPGARIVSFGTSADEEAQLNMRTLYRKGISLLGYGGRLLGAEERRAGLQAALAALAAGELRVVIDEVLPLEQVNEAFTRLLHRQVQGKLVLALD